MEREGMEKIYWTITIVLVQAIVAYEFFRSTVLARIFDAIFFFKEASDTQRRRAIFYLSLFFSFFMKSVNR